MFDPFKKLKLAAAFLGADTDAAAPENLDIAELFGRLSLKDMRAMTLAAEQLLDQPGVRALYETHYMPPPEPMEKLHDLGEGTLGFEYVRYLRHYKLPQPQAPRRSDYADAPGYLLQRVRMTHALLHVLTEYDASPLGELALQAYYIGQLGNMIGGVIVSSGILQITRDTPDLLGAALEVTSEAYQRGKSARSFLGVAWEELWSAQVPQLRELIDLPARTSAVAHLRIENAKPAAPEPRNSSGRSGTFSVSAFTGADDGLAALGRSSSTSQPEKPARVFSGFGSAPVSTTGTPRTTPAREAPSRPEPAAPVERPRPTSQSSLLASFMALSEEAAQPPKPEPKPEPVRPPPPPVRAEPPNRPEPPRIDPRPSSAGKPAVPPPPLPVRPPPQPEPTYKVEDQSKHVAPALSPDDPDYF